MQGIDRSAIVSGLSYFAGFVGCLALQPLAVLSLSLFSLQTLVLIASFLVFIGLNLMLQRMMGFAAASTTFGAPQRLTTGGVFRYSRNPIYLAFLIPLSGLAIFSIPAALAAIAGYLVLMTQFVIKREERDLEREFGQEYLAYRQRTPRWLIV